MNACTVSGLRLPQTSMALVFVFQQKPMFNGTMFLGHNLLAALLVSAIAAACYKRRLRMACLSALAMHLHFAMDLLGSGKHWGIAYCYPFSDHKYTWAWGWELHAWQNFCAIAAMLIVTIVIGIRHKRTPFELLFPAVDEHLFKTKASGTSADT